MEFKKAERYAEQLSDLSGVFIASTMYMYSRGCYAVWVESDMSGRIVLLIDEESVVLWKHNYARWLQEKKQHGTDDKNTGQAEPADGRSLGTEG